MKINHQFRFIALLLAMLGFGVTTGFAATAVPLQLQIDGIVINWQSQRGVPISIRKGGSSDGRGPTQAAQIAAGLTTEPATEQYSTFLAVGAVAAPQATTITAGETNVSQSAISLGLPVAKLNNAVVMVMTRAQVGGAYILQSSTYRFGQVISAPSLNEKGEPLPQGVLASDYWNAEPFSTNKHADARYYWSIHARQVFATQPGPMEIQWVKANPESSLTPTSSTVTQKPSEYSVVGNYVYALIKQNLVVSGSAAKPAVTMYWNQKSFSRVGSRILLPQNLIVGVNLITNTLFPKRVTDAYLPPGTSMPVEEKDIQLLETRTLWYDSDGGTLNAYNVEGRAFIEYYGNRNPDGVSHQFLGFEIVDVRQKADLVKASALLGDPLHVEPATLQSKDLIPQPIPTYNFPNLVYNLPEAANDPNLSRYWAAQETTNYNDVLIYWMKPASLGVLWPQVLDTYQQIWPTDPNAYSHYIRPEAATKELAAETGILLPSANTPKLVYQDILDKPRAFLNTDSIFYTWLDSDHPSVRALIQYKQGPNVFFERVLSWLDSSADIGTTAFTGSVVTNLVDPALPRIVLPKVVKENVLVGQRISAPIGELGADSGSPYVAGHVHLATGTSIATDAYIDPLLDGFETANLGAIIPINAIPGKNRLEVWWHRLNSPPTTSGIIPVYWPSVIGYYTIGWPTSTPDKIVLASNQGSKPLVGLERDGWLYYQNDRTLSGFNPNEEHALLQGGSLWALRDDLNVTAGTNYSSAAFALLEFIDSDGRPSMKPFSVVREDASQGFTFQYGVSVGNNGGLAPILQAPMPLPLLPAPRVTTTTRSLNTEITSLNIGGLTTTNQSIKFGPRSAIGVLNVGMTLGERFSLPTHREYVLAGNVSGVPTSNYWVFLTSADPGENGGISTYKFNGVVSTNRPAAITSVGCPQLDGGVSANLGIYRYIVSRTNLFAVGQNIQVWNAVRKIGNVGTVNATGSTNLFNPTTGLTEPVLFVAVNLNNGLAASAQTIDVVGAASLVWVIANPSTFTFPVGATGWTLRNSPMRTTPNRTWVSNQRNFSVQDEQQEFPFDANGTTFQDRNGTVWFYRGPHDADDPATTTMRFYYKTLPGFYFPLSGTGSPLGVGQQPAVGTITPYLRPYSETHAKYVGDPIIGSNQSLVRGDDNALGISYTTSWSKDVPELPMGQSLTEAVRGLPAIRGQLSARVLYQQSRVVKSATNISVVLHDPTRQKTFAFGSKTDSILNQIPNSVSVKDSFGKYYFPKLPPHLVGRVFFDSTVGKYGSLIFRGEFVKAITGDSYLLPNILSTSDRNYLINLCDASDTLRPQWISAVDGLKTTMVPFTMNQGVWVENPGSVMTSTFLPNELCQAIDQDVPVDSYALTAMGPGTGYVTVAFQDSLSPAASRGVLAVQVVRVSTNLYTGEIKIVNASNPLSEFITLQQVVDLAGKAGSYEFDWRMAAPVDGNPVPVENGGAQPVASTTTGPGDHWLSVDAAKFPDGVRVTLGGTADVQALSDNYLIVRYRTTDPNHPSYGTWSAWTAPQLAEGWIKRVLAGVNPFSQRVTDFTSNEVSDQVSMLTQAGSRWEGNVPLNQDSLNDFGLIPIYETVLNMGRNMSIEAGINYGPANDALLLAAGYISDLYTILGNEAWAEANNPTVSVGDNTGLRSIATSLFPFLGETASLMEQQQALLRGRDDFLTPGTRRAPVYNRLYWNYTRGINAGEIIYALHFDIKPAPHNITGNVGAADAAYMFPQGHGDAYGHYLTALFNYYKLLMNPSFSWVPTSEAVTILDTPVAVSYMHERKFAATAATLARTGQLIFDLAWREAYVSGTSNGWAFLGPNYQNVNVIGSTDEAATKRYWGADHWAARVGQGNYLNWVVGNSLLPDFDPDPLHFGIQKVDRGTVTDLSELPRFSTTLQTAMENAEAHLNPLGLPENTVTFDINPNLLTGTAPQSHFEQVYGRAAEALANAAFAYDQGQDVSAALRSQQDSLAEYIDKINTQEQAFTNQLIEIYGTPYSDDIGPGATYKQGYAGPDVAHFAYVDQTDIPDSGGVLGFADGITGEPADPFTTGQLEVPFFNQEIYSWMTDGYLVDYDTEIPDLKASNYALKNLYRPPNSPDVLEGDYLEITIDTQGYIQKPSHWTGKRTYSGKIQRAISEYKSAWWDYVIAGNSSVGTVQEFNQRVSRFSNFVKYINDRTKEETKTDDLTKTMIEIDAVNKIFTSDAEVVAEMIDELASATETSIPDVFIAGLAAGGSIGSAAKGVVKALGISAKSAVAAASLAITTSTFAALSEYQKKLLRYAERVRKMEYDQEIRDCFEDLVTTTAQFTDRVVDMNVAARKLNLAEANVQTAIQEGYQLLATRSSYRAREAAIIHGYRTRDASYRLFQNEKLERYNTLFNLAQRYALLAAYAYDYETGLLGTETGKKVIQQLVGTRSLGVVDRNGKPQFVGEGAGDAGLSTALATLWADWGVLKGRLGFNNPDGYGTTASLRSENFRIYPDSSGESAWLDVLNRSRSANLLDDPDVRRNCLGIDKGTGLPVPGLVIPFSTTIAEGFNLFGKELAPGDHNFSESSFATKIFSVGVALEGYLGMDPPSANLGALGATGGSSPSDPTTFTDPNALAATPYVYLIPVGVDSMRSPPLGDQSTVRSWDVADLAIPMPFNLSASGFSSKPLWQASDSLQEPLFAVRKHQAFRPVPSASYFSSSIYGGNNGLQRTQYANSRLIGRSVWNSQWKLVIPGSALLSNSEEGLNRFIKSVKDVKVYFVTYSYSGN